MIEDMGLEEEWLSQILRENTKSLYVRGLHLFMRFLDVSKAEELKSLDKRQAETMDCIKEYLKC